MTRKGIKKKDETGEQKGDEGDDPSRRYIRDFLSLRNAIIENCMDCIRDCGRDCLDKDAKPLENIRCPLQKARMEFSIAITEEKDDFPKEKQTNTFSYELK